MLKAKIPLLRQSSSQSVATPNDFLSIKILKWWMHK